MNIGMNRTFAMPKSRLGGGLRLLSLLAIEVALVVALHLLGNVEQLSIDFSNLSAWLSDTPPEIALAASVRILALVFAYWVLATSVLYIIARAFKIPVLLQTMEFATIPGVRRLIDASVAATIIGGTVFGGAGAVFAHQTDASKTIAPSAMESSYKDSRVLYTPTPMSTADEDVSIDAGEQTQKQVVSNEVASTPTQSAPTTTAPIEMPALFSSADDTETPTAVPVATTAAAPNVAGDPARDSDGHYIPTPVGNTETPVTQEEPTDNTPTPVETTSPEQTSTTQPSKVVVDPTTPSTTSPPASPSTTTSPATPSTTTPKTTTPSTTTPPVSPNPTTPEDPDDVQVQGQQVERPTQSETRTHTVVSGDNFWKIARQEVENSLGRDANNAEVASYWVKLIDANRSVIRSGDPNLIFPGEVFTLPPV